MIDTMTSIFAGFVVFAILGVMAAEGHTEVEHVVEASKYSHYYMTTVLILTTRWQQCCFLN